MRERQRVVNSCEMEVRYEGSRARREGMKAGLHHEVVQSSIRVAHEVVEDHELLELFPA